MQAGHKNMTSGSTGAPGEREWNKTVVPLIASKLESKGYEVYQCDAFANTDPKVTGVDWDLFLAIHYDADIYNDRGGFIDTPDQSVDYVSTESQRIASKMRENYFTDTGIPNKPTRSNANTKFYYMWNYLSANTPCVLIECGVGNRKPEDHETLFNRMDLVANSIVRGIDMALNYENATQAILDALRDKLEAVEKELDEMRESRNKWREKYESLDKETTKEIASKIAHIESLQKTIADMNVTITQLNDAQAQFDAKIAKLDEEILTKTQDIDQLKDNLKASNGERDKLIELYNQVKADNVRLLSVKYTTREAIGFLLRSLK